LPWRDRLFVGRFDRRKELRLLLASFFPKF
jgi:hypothetical protein